MDIDTDLTSIEYGFTHPLDEKAYVLGEACYSEAKGKTHFVHTKFWQQIPHNIGDMEKVALRRVDSKSYFRQKHPMSRYKLEFLQSARLDALNERLSDILGTEQIPEFYQGNLIGSNALTNQQFYSTFKLAWNYVMFNGEDTLKIWSNLQPNVKSKEPIDLYIGTHGILEKVNSARKMIPLYLSDGNKFPVPEYIWMLVVQGNKAVVFAVLNDDQPQAHDEPLCQSQCSRTRVLLNNDLVSQAIANSRIQCCEYKAFKKNVREMPSLNRAFELLTE